MKKEDMLAMKNQPSFSYSAYFANFKVLYLLSLRFFVHYVDLYEAFAFRLFIQGEESIHELLFHG